MTVDDSQNLFRSEYELEMEAWLRRRFRTVCVWYLILGALVLCMRMFFYVQSSEAGHWTAVLITLAQGAAAIAIICHFLFAKMWLKADREQLLRAASVMILLLGATTLAKSALMQVLVPKFETEFLVPLFFWHFVACLLLPWTPRESLRPIVPLLAIWAVGDLLWGDDDLMTRVLRVIFAPGMLIPGLIICAVRLKQHGERFRVQMVGKQFTTMRQEFARARSIHESLFPEPYDDGFVRFEYAYRPMRELGGDYVHARVSPQGLIHVTLIDVTGHGLAAALTVNRLYGELERIFGENPQSEPGEVLELLNRYIYLTLATHDIFATAACFMLDPYLSRLTMANAGHPPAYLRGANGVVTSLQATTYMLGAMGATDFSAQQRVIEMSPGDVLVCYTDGAFEGRDRMGTAMGLSTLELLMHRQPPPRNWPQYITAAVEKHTAGRSEDDVLVASLSFLVPRPQEAHAQRELATTQ
jgi:hypothetical protein